MSADPESELIRRCRAGAADAWDELFDRHYAATTHFVFKLGHDFTWEDAEEISQETFLSVIKNLDSFKGRSRFQTWVFRVATNKARDFHKHRAAAKRGGGQAVISLQAETPEHCLVVDPPSNAPGPDATLMNAERMTLLHLALEKLGEPCREIIELRYFGGLSYEEISQSLALDPGTVSSRLSKCLDRLEDIARTVFPGAKPAPTSSNH
jgi:RNA polymerase sigma-70 factor (ECF subfamily)